jgi:uncharacterized repeat protein (TIGR03803 family)
MNKRNWSAMTCAVFLLCAATAIVAPTQTFTTLHGFDGTNGSYPLAGLVQAFNGNLYGTTFSDGASGWGTVFEIRLDGTLTSLYSFCSQSDCTGGSAPEGELVQATNGSFYGTTSEGANGDSGTVFKLTPSGALTILYRFCSQSNCTDGGAPPPGCSKPPTGTSTGQRRLAASTAMARSSRSPQVAHSQIFTAFARRAAALTGCPSGGSRPGEGR